MASLFRVLDWQGFAPFARERLCLQEPDAFAVLLRTLRVVRPRSYKIVRGDGRALSPGRDRHS